jgi:hypothetical protein
VLGRAVYQTSWYASANVAIFSQNGAHGSAGGYRWLELGIKSIDDSIVEVSASCYGVNLAVPRGSGGWVFGADCYGLVAAYICQSRADRRSIRPLMRKCSATVLSCQVG